MRMEEAIDELGEPYPGLRSFRRDETHIFFGREGTIREMVDRLAAHRFLAVTGVSGSGKSSLVKTGLLDALDRGLLVEAGSDWRVVDFRPGVQPLTRMTVELTRALEKSFSNPELGLIAGAGRLARRDRFPLRHQYTPAGRPVRGDLPLPAWPERRRHRRVRGAAAGEREAAQTPYLRRHHHAVGLSRRLRPLP
jgi:Novel STAND NTPase 1